MELKGKTAAVTGAAGFIGSATCKRLAAEGCEVVGLEVDDSLAGKVEAAGARFALADITDRTALDEALDGADLVVHTAAYVREWGTMEEFVEVNVGGTVNVLDAAETAGVERVVHLSSVVVYGYESEDEQDESAHRRNCGIPYIDTKSASDRIAIRRGAVVIRPGDVYGPGSVPWVERMAGLLASGRAALPGQGDGQMLPVYIDDLVESIILAARNGKPGHAYTVWDGSDLTFDQYLTALAAQIGAKPPRKVPRAIAVTALTALEAGAKAIGRTPELGRHGITLVDRRGKASNARAREELGWEPKVDLDEGLRRSGDWLRESGV